MAEEVKRSQSMDNKAYNADLQGELDFLKLTLRKCRIAVTVVNKCDLCDHIERAAKPFFASEAPPELSKLNAKTFYKYVDSFERNFAIIPARLFGEESALVVGPFMTVEVDDAYKERVLAPLIFDHESKSRAAKYLQTLAVVPEGSAIITMLQSFAEIAFRTPSYSVVYTRDSGAKIESPSAPVLKNGDEILVKMREMERRYEFENEIMRSVKNGSHGTEEILRVAFTPDMFEQRLLDPLRNAKNYCIIMNTLLRKAAEEGGVHPIYIDEASSYNAERIEALSSCARTGGLMGEMFRDYCRLVRRHAHKEYSPIVRRAVIMIDADLTADLSAGAIASALDVSLGYLSTVFKKEVGETVSEFVRKKRMEYAAHLLTTTEQQVQSVAISVGIVDLNYFTRLFKAHTGKTPTEYRKEK